MKLSLSSRSLLSNCFTCLCHKYPSRPAWRVLIRTFHIQTFHILTPFIHEAAGVWRPSGSSCLWKSWKLKKVHCTVMCSGIMASNTTCNKSFTGSQRFIMWNSMKDDPETGMWTDSLPRNLLFTMSHCTVCRIIMCKILYIYKGVWLSDWWTDTRGYFPNCTCVYTVSSSSNTHPQIYSSALDVTNTSGTKGFYITGIRNENWRGFFMCYFWSNVKQRRRKWGFLIQSFYFRCSLSNSFHHNCEA